MSDITLSIDPLHLVDLQNPHHPSVFDENADYNMLILRLPVLHPDEVTSRHLSFLFSPSGTLQYLQENEGFETLEEPFQLPYQRINQAVDHLLKSFVEYQEQIVDLEEDLYTQTSRPFLSKWLKLKSELLKTERILLRTTSTLEDFIEFYANDKQFPINQYSDIHEHLERTMRTATLQLSKLDDLYNFYNAQSNDRMNRMIYILTIISAIFLPLNLIVGFFGMNTSDLPFSTDAHGTYFAVSLMLISIVVTSVMILLGRK